VHNVLYATDANYWMHLYVSMYSLLRNNGKSKITVYILTDEANEEFIDNLSFLYELGNLADCIIIEVDSSVAEAYPLGYHFTKAIYYRLFIGQLLPEEVKKILYLDCDTIIDGPLDVLFKTDLKEYVLGAAPDYYLGAQNKLVRLNLSKDVKYFNSGVLLINMEKWRSMNVERRALEYIEKNSDTIELPDQDALNTVLHYDYKELSSEYNFLIDFKAEREEGENDISPAIIHYIDASCKPWFYMSNHYLKDRYWVYLRETPYRCYREVDRNLKNASIKLVRLFKRWFIRLAIGVAKKIPVLYKPLRSLYRRLQNKELESGNNY